MKKSIRSVFLALMFLTILSSGCAPTSTPVPKAGHWEGEADDVNSSFTVTTDGNIQSLEMIWKQGSVSCKVTVNEILVKADGTFTLTQSATNSGTGEIIEDALRIDGTFNSTTGMTGTLTLKVCEDYTLIAVDASGKEVGATRSLSAEWKGP